MTTEIEEKDAHAKFVTFGQYWGKLAENHDTIVYGFDTFSATHDWEREIKIPSRGGCFGYVQRGTITIEINGSALTVNGGTWFTTTEGAHFKVGDATRVAVFQRRICKEFHGPLNSMGEVEGEGRLKYINGCRDSILSAPSRKGDPCLNALYMPRGIDQTMHTHPSTRCGIIIEGDALCETPDSQHQLAAGVIFFMGKDCWHKFRTDQCDTTLKLVAYHPDSDFGPTDENHPMLNRTLVNGVSANVMPEIQTK